MCLRYICGSIGCFKDVSHIYFTKIVLQKLRASTYVFEYILKHRYVIGQKINN